MFTCLFALVLQIGLVWLQAPFKQVVASAKLPS